MVFKFRLGRRVRFIHCESVSRYPLSTVRVCCTKPTDCAWVISECVDLWCQQVERLDCLFRTLLVLGSPHRLFARESTCFLVSKSLTTMSSCFTRELFRLECSRSVAGEVPESITEVPCLYLKGVECIVGMLPEFCIRMPDSHVKEQIKNGLVMRWKEEAVEHRETTLDWKGSERAKRGVLRSKPGVCLQSVLLTCSSWQTHPLKTFKLCPGQRLG